MALEINSEQKQLAGYFLSNTPRCFNEYMLSPVYVVEAKTIQIVSYFMR